MKTKMLVLGAFIAGILSAFFGGKAFATAGDTAEISSGTWEICVNATLDTQSPDFSLDITKSGFKSQLVLGGGECKTIKLTGSSAYTVSLGNTMSASSVNYEVSGSSLTFNVANSLNNYLNAFGSVTYTTEGSGEESDFELLFSMPGTCYLNGNANVSGDTCKDGDGNPLTDKKYIDTGVALFSEGNAARDFEIYFTLDDYASTQPNNQGTLFNAKYENSSMLYPGFTLRMSGSNVQTMELTGRIGNDNTDADKAKKDISTASLKGKEMKIVRVGGLVSYSIDGGELIEFQNYQNFSRYFEQSAVFGASLQPNGTPQRYYDGTVSNIRIYLKKLEEETTGNIVFDANGGTGTMAKIEDIELGTDVTLPANTFTKKNANFTGWNTAADGSGTAYADEGTVTISEVGKLTLYAQWEDIPVGSIEFNANGGTGTMSVVEDIPVGTNTTLPANTFTMKNGTFTGWNTAADGSGVDYADEATVAITSTSRIYLYAQWEIVPVGSIEFNANGGTGGTMGKIEDIPVGTDVVLPANTFTLNNATFKGWNTRLDGTGADYIDGGTVTISSTDRITLYAQWDGEAILTSGFNFNAKIKQLTKTPGRDWTGTNTNVRAIKEADALPDGIDFLHHPSYTVSKDNSPIRIYVWFNDDDLDGDGVGDGVINIFTTANTIKCESLDYLFYKFDSLSDISALAGWDTSSVKGIDNAFYGAKSLSDISALASWNTSSLTDMSHAFDGTAITDVGALRTERHDEGNYVSWDVSNVTDMQSLFSSAGSLSDISALASWDTSKVKNMGQMFYGAKSLSDISALTSWNTSKNTNMSSMFSGTAITDVNALEAKQHDGNDYVSWDVSNVTNMASLFYGAKSLSDISALASWNTSKVTSMSRLFGNTELLSDISALASWNTSSLLTINYMFYNGAINNVDALETKRHDGNDYTSWDVSNVTDMQYLFGSATSLSDISALASWNTSNVEDMNHMFDGATSLSDISALASWNTPSLKNTSYLFRSATSLSDISALASWNTSNVEDISYMFAGTSITDTDALETKQHEGKNYVSWDTSKVTNMDSVFFGAKTLTNIAGLASWNTSNVTNIKAMFMRTSITNTDALETKQHEGKNYVSWDTSKVTNMANVFHETKTLTDIAGLYGWNTSNVTNMNSMFRLTSITNVSSLETKQHEGRDYVSWDTSSVTAMSGMFESTPIVNISALASWNISNVTTMTSMFRMATKMENPAVLDCWNVDIHVYMTTMFQGVPAKPLPSWYPWGSY